MASQWSGGSIPAPTGVTPNLIDPQSQWAGNLALHTICLTTTTAFMAMRLYTRISINKTKLGPDDCECGGPLASLILAYTYI